MIIGNQSKSHWGGNGFLLINLLQIIISSMFIEKKIYFNTFWSNIFLFHLFHRDVNGVKVTKYVPAKFCKTFIDNFLKSFTKSSSEPRYIYQRMYRPICIDLGCHCIILTTNCLETSIDWGHLDWVDKTKCQQSLGWELGHVIMILNKAPYVILHF